MSKKIISAVIASFLLYTSQSQITSSNLNSFKIDDNSSISSSSRIPVTISSSSLLRNNVRFEDNPNRLFDDSSLKVPIVNSISGVSTGTTVRFEDNPNKLFDDSSLKIPISRSSSSSLPSSTLRFDDNPNRSFYDNSNSRLPSSLSSSSSSSSSTLKFEDNPNRLIDDSILLKVPTISGIKFDENSSSRLTDVNVKQNWSYLVGVKGDCAAKVINNQRRDLKVFIIRQGSAVTYDYRFDRVRIFVDVNNNVIQTPVIG